MNDLSRRSVLGGALAFNASLALPSLGMAQGRAAEDGPGWAFFSSSEAAWVEAAIERLIPSEPEWPGARDAGVGVYIDRQLAGPFGAGERLYLGGPIKPGMPGQGYQLGLTPAEVYRRSLASLPERMGPAFPSATDGEKDKMLGELETTNIDLGGVPSPVFFETLLANTIEGYFADPFYGGNKNMVSWRMIGFPGAHAAYLGIYTRHGVLFDKPPVGMAEVAGGGHAAGHLHGDHASGDGTHR